MIKYLCIFLFSFSLFLEKSWSETQSTQHDLSVHQNLYTPADSSFCADCSKPNPDLKNNHNDIQAITQLTRMFHRSIESDHNHIHSIRHLFEAFRNKEQWLALLNFYKMSKRAVRAFNLESDKEHLKNHAKNLAILFPISHFVEVSTAPLFVAIGTIHEWPSIVIGFGGSLLSLMAVPGLDPLCILIMATYPLKPVHKSISFIRNIASKTLRGVITTIKLDTLVSTIYNREDPFDLIQKKLHLELGELLTVEWNTFEKGHQLSLFNQNDKDPFLSLKRIWDERENKFYIQSIWLSSSADVDIIRKSVLKLFSWNVRAAIREVLELQNQPEKISSYEKEFFVDQVTVNQGGNQRGTQEGIEVIYKEKAIDLRGKIQFQNPFQAIRRKPCKNTFLSF